LGREQVRHPESFRCADVGAWEAGFQLDSGSRFG
jgi:hypothetical protein